MQTNTHKRRVKWLDEPAPYEVKRANDERDKHYARIAKAPQGAEKENPPVSTAEIKPATRTSPFYWRDGYEQKINWSGRKKADETRIVANKEMVAGQDYELNNIPRTGSLRESNMEMRRRGEVGRRKWKEGRV